jgi:hypothetical protein
MIQLPEWPDDLPPIGSFEFYKLLNSTELEAARRRYNAELAKQIYSQLNQPRSNYD